MKKILFSLILPLAFLHATAQQVEYQTFIYTDDDLAQEIARQYEEENTRGYLGDLFNASKESAKGIASGYVTSFIDLGVNAIASLVTRNARQKEEWEKMARDKESLLI